MACILFYSPFDQRSRDTESLMIAFKKQGHRVISLSQASGNDIHAFLQTHGIETFASPVGKANARIRLVRQLSHFVRFCRRHRVDVVYSHLEPANVVAALGQFFIKAKVFICRHHADLAGHAKFDKSLSYRMTYRLARNIIVVSEKTRQHAVAVEGLPADKLHHINLAYDFSLYPEPNPLALRDSDEQVILVTAGHLSTFKRPDVSIYVAKHLADRGVNVKLYLLGRGPEEENLRKLSESLALKNNVVFTGYVRNALDYFASADFLLHPSISEASCVVVKEAAICNLPVVVCDGVGDFNDYIVDGYNGYRVSSSHYVAEASEKVFTGLLDKEKLKSMGQRLNERVRALFGIDSIISRYESLNK